MNAQAATTDAFVRELGAMERLLHFYSAEHPRHFCVVAELAGAIHPEAYRAAFDKVQARHPMLSVYIRDDATRGAGFYRSDRAIPITILPRDEHADWRRVVERELARALPDDTPPLMRATILHGADCATIVLTFHHAISDGLSGALVIQDLIDALDGQPLPSLPNMPALETLAETAPAMRDAIACRQEIFPPDAATLRAIADSPLWRPFEGDTPRVFTVGFDRSETACIRAASKAHGTTVHGAICAAMVHSVGAQTQKETFTILTAIDLRSLVGVTQRMCSLLVGATAFPFQTRPPVGFWNLARYAIEALAHARSPEGVARSMGLMQASVPADGDSKLACGLLGALQYDAVVSNLGVLPLASRATGSLRLQAFWGPAVQGRFAHERVIGAATWNGELRILQSSPGHIPDFLPEFRHVLLAACEAPSRG